MKLSKREQRKPFKNETISYICKEKFENKCMKDKKVCKVKDHCHYTGEYRGAAHSVCNLKDSLSEKLLS